MSASTLPRLIHVGRGLCGELGEAERREWWLANGLGAYAAGTLSGSLTRRYHGLLVAPLDPPLGRRLVVAKADATLFDGEREWPLFTNRWSDGAVSPAGHVHIEQFRLEGSTPVWQFACADLVIEQRIWMEPGEHTTYVAYRLMGGTPPSPITLRVALLVNDRDHHHVTRVGDIDPRVEAQSDRLRMTVHGDHRLQLIAVGGSVRPDRQWIEGLDLTMERYRGLEDSDNHLQVGVADLELAPDRWCGLVASLAETPNEDLALSLEDLCRRDRALVDRARQAHPEFRQAPDWIEQLLLAADRFVIERDLRDGSEGESVIAGYPWFGDWGRDTMIALPGLTLVTGRVATSRRILETFDGFVDQGLLPNLFPGTGSEPAYNSVDAALWYIEAWRAFVETTGDAAVIPRIYGTLESIIGHYRDGTRFGICMDPEDGLIAAAAPGVQLTWMDAKAGDWVVTPRM
ncbi:MAG: glycogen debranching enzyme N-terminal domain-containing protein, partial [Pseudomonadota bacterium]|nr:glycogen debranching enzyme N-terminal domain-containing protein [Pseudomonadota bacterium]